jgi:uncharacterized Rmd1/YagE family protein
MRSPRASCWRATNASISGHRGRRAPGPAAREEGRTPGGRRAILKHIGTTALLVQHRLSGRVAVTDKPDVIWDRPDLERLYARLQDEYELTERADALSRKLAVISDTAEVLTDMIDTKRSLRLEFIIVMLIVFEIVITAYQILSGAFTAPRSQRA